MFTIKAIATAKRFHDKATIQQPFDMPAPSTTLSRSIKGQLKILEFGCMYDHSESSVDGCPLVEALKSLSLEFPHCRNLSVKLAWASRQIIVQLKKLRNLWRVGQFSRWIHLKVCCIFTEIVLAKY
jgi:hypothetical protein